MRVDRTHACPDTSAVRPEGDSLYCDRCEHAVLDLRHVTERQARALIATQRGADGKVCATLFTDREGRASFLVEPPKRRLPLAGAALVATMATACAEPHGTATTPASVAAHPETQSKQPTPPTPAPHDAGVPSASQCSPPRDGGTASARDRRHPRNARGRERRTHPPEEGYGGLLMLDL